MTDKPAETAVTPQADGHEDAAPDESVRDVFARLYADGRAYAAAEADKQKARAGLIGAGVRDAAIFAVVAIMLIFATLVAFLIGLIIALSPQLGPLWATFAVLGASLLVTTGLLLMAKARISRMKKAITP
ncbi:phage holin family protein [Sphingobium sp. B2]|uniref:phage holin family protein n=1 Tax=Sphingobium sp. B2 TaxID=2583228 RepID=UPI0011A656AC|nr:phage holin family protein [Sphingobium sp. B2]